MTKNIISPKTYLGHRNQWLLRQFLQKIFRSESPQKRVEELATFLRSNPLPLEDFPRHEGTYTRTVLYREENGYEAMAARWSKGTVSSIHGHPYFNMYFVVHGCLNVDDYIKTDEGITLASSAKVGQNQVASFVGQPGLFDNDIHRVQAIEETLSIHISSDDSTKGEIYG